MNRGALIFGELRQRMLERLTHHTKREGCSSSVDNWEPVARWFEEHADELSQGLPGYSEP